MADATAAPTPEQVFAMIKAAEDAARAKGTHSMSPQAVALGEILRPVKAALGEVMMKRNLEASRMVMLTGFSGVGIRSTPELAKTVSEATEVKDATGVRAWWFDWPGCAKDAVVVTVHGGGRIGGTAAPVAGTEAAFCEAVSRIAKCRVLTVDYTLAPEANGTRQVDECIAVYKYLLDTLKISPKRIAWMGGSGGGSLGLSVVLRIARTGLPSPACAWILSPMTTYRPLPSIKSNMDIDIFTGQDPSKWEWFYDLISNKGLPTEIPRDHPDVSPLEGDFYGVCPLLVSVSRQEALCDDGLQVIAKARSAGVSVRSQIAEELYHVWPVFFPYMPEAAEALGVGGAYLREHLHGAE